MDRRVAVPILWLFGLAALGIAAWGGGELFHAYGALGRGEAVVAFDTSSFWFLGGGSIVLLPMLSLFRSERVHAALFGALVVWFVAVPVLAHQVFVAHARAHGYATEAVSLFLLRWVELTPG